MANDQSSRGWFVKLVRDEILKKLFWLVLAGIGAFLYTYAHGHPGPNAFLLWVPTVCFIAILLAATGWYLYNRFSWKRYYYPHMGHAYQVLNATYEYIIDKNDVLHFSRTVKIRAVEDNVSSYIDKFLWTGGHSEIPSPGAGAESTRLSTRAGIWTFYVTEFPNPIRKRQTHTFTTTWPDLTNWKESSPFVSASTEQPVKSIKFVVQVPEDSVRDNQVKAETMRGIESTFAFSTQNMTFSHGRVEWSIKARLYCHYRLRWVWRGGPEMKSLPGNVEQGAESK